jgi:hypothetical protein
MSDLILIISRNDGKSAFPFSKERILQNSQPSLTIQSSFSTALAKSSSQLLHQSELVPILYFKLFPSMKVGFSTPMSA